jgi:hypothetical protein
MSQIIFGQPTNRNLILVGGQRLANTFKNFRVVFCRASNADTRTAA